MQIWGTPHKWTASLDVKDMLFMFPLWEHYTVKLAFERDTVHFQQAALGIYKFLYYFPRCHGEDFSRNL